MQEQYTTNMNATKQTSKTKKHTPTNISINKVQQTLGSEVGKTKICAKPGKRSKTNNQDQNAKNNETKNLQKEMKWEKQK